MEGPTGGANFGPANGYSFCKIRDVELGECWCGNGAVFCGEEAPVDSTICARHAHVENHRRQFEDLDA